MWAVPQMVRSAPHLKKSSVVLSIAILEMSWFFRSPSTSVISLTSSVITHGWKRRRGGLVQVSSGLHSSFDDFGMLHIPPAQDGFVVKTHKILQRTTPSIPASEVCLGCFLASANLTMVNAAHGAQRLHPCFPTAAPLCLSKTHEHPMGSPLLS